VIGSLRGRLLELSPEEVLLDVHGVGYRVFVPLTTYYELERLAAGAEVFLHVHTHVREDTLALFGFWSASERQLFAQLLGVSGIGPRLARAILSMPPAELQRALAAGDVARLATIPGVGKKTAERMVLELRERMAALALAATSEMPAPPLAGEEEVVSALINLGYRRPEAERAVAAVAREQPDGEIAELLRRSLKRLARL
jgi:holliday junction DNA helicase RuvA